MISFDIPRETVAAKKIALKGGRNVAGCDLCEHNKAMHLHEIIERKKTVGNDVARQLSFDKNLTAIVCADCHIRHAHKNDAADFLLHKNCRLYGAENVERSYTALSNAMRLNLGQFHFIESEFEIEWYEDQQLYYHLLAWENIPVNLSVALRELKWESDKFSEVFKRLTEKGVIECQLRNQ